MGDRPSAADAERWKRDPQIVSAIEAIERAVRDLPVIGEVATEEMRDRSLEMQRKRVSHLNASTLELRIAVIADLYGVEVDALEGVFGGVIDEVQFAVLDDMTLNLDVRLRRSVTQVNFSVELPDDVRE